MSSTIPDPATTDWVPLFDLGRQPIKYLGQYNPSTTYNDGDVVIGPDGLAYVCVMDSTLNSTPGGWPAQPVTPPAYGTTLPASPVNGQEAILVDSTTNPTYQWRFRYNASSTSAYKWEFIGGAPIAKGEDNTVGITGGWVTVGPQILVPRTGEYVLWGHISVGANPGNAGYWCQAGFCTVGGGPLGGQSISVDPALPTDGSWRHMSAYERLSLVGGSSYMYTAQAPGTGPSTRIRHLAIQPVRVS